MSSVSGLPAWILEVLDTANGFIHGDAVLALRGCDAQVQSHDPTIINDVTKLTT